MTIVEDSPDPEPLMYSGTSTSPTRASTNHIVPVQLVRFEKTPLWLGLRDSVAPISFSADLIRRAQVPGFLSFTREEADFFTRAILSNSLTSPVLAYRNALNRFSSCIPSRCGDLHLEHSLSSSAGSDSSIASDFLSKKKWSLLFRPWKSFMFSASSVPARTSNDEAFSAVSTETTRRSRPFSRPITPNSSSRPMSVSRSFDIAYETLAKKTFRMHDGTPIDVAVRDIARGGFPVLLSSLLPLCYFALFLTQEQSIENLFFWMDMSQFHSECQEDALASPTNTPSQRILDLAEDLYRLYLGKESYFELNVTHQARVSVIQSLRSGSIDCFHPILYHIWDLLCDAFTRFRSSPIWKRMEKDLGWRTALHSFDTAYDILTAFLEVVTKQEAWAATADMKEDVVWAWRARLDAFLETQLALYFQQEDIESWD